MSYPILTIVLSPSPEASKAEKSFQFTDISYKSVDLDLPRSQAPEVANCQRNWDFPPPRPPLRSLGAGGVMAEPEGTC